MQNDALPLAKMASPMQEFGVTKAEPETETMFAASQILVVDDDPDFEQIFRRVPAKNGRQLALVVYGEQVLQDMRTGRPDLVLLDVMMTTLLDGIGVVRKVPNDPAPAAIPDIMIPSIDGNEHAAIRPDRVQIVIDAWISKPAGPKHLLKAVRRFHA